MVHTVNTHEAKTHLSRPLAAHVLAIFLPVYALDAYGVTRIW